MITIKRLSAWKYDKSASGGVAMGIVALEGCALFDSILWHAWLSSDYL
jgi:hypothetical protein